MFFSVYLLKARWKNLRTYYFRECRKYENPHSEDGTEAGTKSAWHLFKRMQFLKNCAGVSLRDSKLPEQKNVDDQLSSSTEEEAPDNIKPSTPVSTECCSLSTSLPPKKNKCSIDISAQNEEILEMKRKKFELLQKEYEKPINDDSLFFDSLLPYIKDIPTIRKLRLRNKIQELVLSELEDLQNVSSTSSSLPPDLKDSVPFK